MAVSVPEVAKVVAAAAPVEEKVLAPVAQTVASPKVNKKKAAKKEEAAAPVEKVGAPVAVAAKTAAPLSKSLSPEEIQAAINNIININTTSSAVTATSSDINNNTKAKTAASKKSTGAASAATTSVPLSVSDVIEASIRNTSANSKSNPIVNLKQTNLSESMILIEKDNQLVKSQIQSSSSSSTSSQQTQQQQASGSSSKSKSSRTESNQSSSDSLQDVEGDVEG